MSHTVSGRAKNHRNLWEKLLNSFGWESSQQISTNARINELRARYSEKTKSNDEIKTLSNHLVDNFLSEHFYKSPPLESLLTRLEHHLGAFREIERRWDTNCERAERARLSVSDENQLPFKDGRRLPRHIEVDNLRREAQREHDEMLVAQAQIFQQWAPQSSDFEELALCSKDGGLKVPIDLEIRDLLVSIRSTYRVGAFFTATSEYGFETDFTAVLAKENRLHEAMEQVKSQMPNIIADFAGQVLYFRETLFKHSSSRWVF